MPRTHAEFKTILLMLTYYRDTITFFSDNRLRVRRDGADISG
jgi:hypothetical protein